MIHPPLPAAAIRNGQARAAHGYNSRQKAQHIEAQAPRPQGLCLQGVVPGQETQTCHRAIYGKKAASKRLVYAEWAAKRYRIRLKLDGGSTASSQARTYTIKHKAELKTPTKPAYQFKGWYTDKHFRKRVKSARRLYFTRVGAGKSRTFKY